MGLRVPKWGQMTLTTCESVFVTYGLQGPSDMYLYGKHGGFCSMCNHCGLRFATSLCIGCDRQFCATCSVGLKIHDHRSDTELRVYNGVRQIMLFHVGRHNQSGKIRICVACSYDNCLERQDVLGDLWYAKSVQIQAWRESDWKVNFGSEETVQSTEEGKKPNGLLTDVICKVTKQQLTLTRRCLRICTRL